MQKFAGGFTWNDLSFMWNDIGTFPYGTYVKPPEWAQHDGHPVVGTAAAGSPDCFSNTGSGDASACIALCEAEADCELVWYGDCKYQVVDSQSRRGIETAWTKSHPAILSDLILLAWLLYLLCFGCLTRLGRSLLHEEIH